jgi:REG-2-like HAD superfamily hydrolase
LLARLGHPERDLNFIHIAGTNGKGSTAAALDSILQAAGFTPGLYSSPHLVDFRERFRIGGRPVAAWHLEREFRPVLAAIRKLPAARRPTFFEAATVLALRIFRSAGVDFVVWETGLGGRLDATNVVRPELCLLTSLGRDHEEILGPGYRNIGREKAGILKRGVPVFSAPWPAEAQRVLARRARQLRCPWKTVRPISTGEFPLAGKHQRQNAALAAAAARYLAFPEFIIRRGLARTRWPARFMVLRKKTSVGAGWGSQRARGGSGPANLAAGGGKKSGPGDLRLSEGKSGGGDAAQNPEDGRKGLGCGPAGGAGFRPADLGDFTGSFFWFCGRGDGGGEKKSAGHPGAGVARAGGGTGAGARGEGGVIRAVFFDAGGTLLRTAEPVGRTYARLAGHYGWQAEEEPLEQGFRSAWKKRIVEGAGADGTLGREGWKKILRASVEAGGMPEGFPFGDYFEEVYAHFARPDAWRDFPETEAVLERLQRLGIRIGILSNWDPRLRRVLAGFGWSERLDPVLISEEVGAEKPAAMIFRKAEAAAGLGAAQCALVGDDPISDQRGAEGAGWRWALVARPDKGLGEALASLGF